MVKGLESILLLWISMKTFVISDTHFEHERIIELCNRPFNSLDEMNHQMIQNWNNTVSNQDTIIHGGDFALNKKERGKEILDQLNGYKILVIGNHDRSAKQMKEMGFHEVYQEYKTEVKIPQNKIRRVCFVHRPPNPAFIQKHLGIHFFIHGHTHLSNIQTSVNVLNISAEALNYIPIDLEYLVSYYSS